MLISRHPYVSSIATDRVSKLHPVSARSCSTSFAGRSTLVRPCVRVHRRFSFMSSFYFSCSTLRVLFILLGLFMGFEVSSHTTPVLWCVASEICSKQHAAFLCSSYLDFLPCVSLTSNSCIQPVVLTQPQLGRNSILFCQRDQISISFITCR